MTTIGAIFQPAFPPERLRAVAVAADEAGLDQLWLWEDCFRESGVASAAAVLAWTSRLRVGIGVLPVPLRNVALTAMEVATMHRLFPGRLLAGVGHGVQDWMGQVGARVDSPLTLLREQLEALRVLLAGGTATVDGRYVHLDAVALDWPPVADPRPALLAAAEGPRTLRLAGALADGTVLPGGSTPDVVRRACALIDEGRAQAGRTDPHSMTVFVPAATGPGARERVDAECARWQWPSSVGRAVAGSVDAVAEQVQAWVDAGADTVVLQPAVDEGDLEGFVAFAAEVGRRAVAQVQ